MYRLFATRPTDDSTTFIWNGTIDPGVAISSANNRFHADGHEATVSGGSSMVAEQNIAGGIDLNFFDRDRLLWSFDPNIGSPIRITFNPPVRKAGAQISASAGVGTASFDFVAVVIISTASGNKRFEKVCTSKDVRDGSASFVGVKSDPDNDPIVSIEFDVKKKPRTRRTINQYGINQLTVVV
jgi:hypothetical protein